MGRRKGRNFTSHIPRTRPTSPPLSPTYHTTGVILRTSAANSSRYAYFPLPVPFVVTNPDGGDVDSSIAASLYAAPHFPNITILDCATTFLLYETNDSFPYIYHVYDLITRRHHPIEGPSSATSTIAAALNLCGSGKFKVLLVNINQHHGNFICVAQQELYRHPSLLFNVYSSECKGWVRVCTSSAVSEALLSSRISHQRRKPVHAGGCGTIYLDIMDRFLLRFSAGEEHLDVVPKQLLSWESLEMTRYGECKGRLQCARMNSTLKRIEIYEWDAEKSRQWRLVLVGKENSFSGKVVALNPAMMGCVIQRTTNDEISVYHLVQKLLAIIIHGRGPECASGCIPGLDWVTTAAAEGCCELRRCRRPHPHENVGGHEAEVFPVWYTS